MDLPSPAAFKSAFPLNDKDFVLQFRNEASLILQRKDPRLAAIVGPCSIHDETSAYEYAQRLKNLTKEISPALFPVMRVFIEKPRSKLGWKGLVYDPHLDHSCDIAKGLELSRKIMLNITEMGVAIATELLDPILLPYFDDLLTWGFIGARTSASQPHRMMASNLSFPVGFKNDCQGRIDEACAGILSSQSPHSYIGINNNGKVATIHSQGNPLSHLVLRGSSQNPNYDEHSIKQATKYLETLQLSPLILIDCSHDNCQKNYTKQKAALQSVISQAEKNPHIIGFMLESHLYEGKQPLNDPSTLKYGQSITDGCIGWEETQDLLLSIAMSSVQN